MSNTLATISFRPQNNLVKKGIRVEIIILSVLMKRLRLRDLVIGQGQEVTESGPEVRSSELKSSSFSVLGMLSAAPNGRDLTSEGHLT